MEEPKEPMNAYLTLSPEAQVLVDGVLASVTNGPPPEPTFIKTAYGCNPVADRLKEMATFYRGEYISPLQVRVDDFAELCDLVAKIARAIR